jgi:hypothetical protein
VSESAASFDFKEARRCAEGVLAGEPGARYMGVDRELAEYVLALLAWRDARIERHPTDTEFYGR